MYCQDFKNMKIKGAVARKDKNKDTSFTSKHTMQQSLTIRFSG